MKEITDVLYELGFKFNFLMLIPFFVFIILLAGGIFLPKIKHFKENKKLLRLSKALPNALAVCTVIITLVWAVFEVTEYKTLMTSVTEETMLCAEGTVTDYKFGENGNETFSIGETEFEIIPDKFNYGYNVSANDGGVIKEGEKLKIGYVDYKGEKKIVYIEKITEE